MIYVTQYAQKRYQQLDFDTVFFGKAAKFYDPSLTKDTVTICKDSLNMAEMRAVSVGGMCDALQSFYDRWKYLYEVDRASLYTSFKIPKATGGYRQIDAPAEELKMALRELKDIMELTFGSKYHTSAFAYIKGRSTIDAVRRHQHNQSRWFLKTDFSNFFGSTTKEFVMKQLSMIYPYCLLFENPNCEKLLDDVLELCFLNGGLPQGTPMSPFITNVIMVPIDHAINKYCNEHHPRLVYTRYADDMQISSKFSFMFTSVVKDISNILEQFEAPFEIKPKKTHYGSSAGRNWILGVMLNKDNEITVGHVKKKRLMNDIFNMMSDYEEGKKWSVEDIQQLQGNISYYKMVEGEKIDKIIEKYSLQFNKSFEDVCKELLTA